MITYQLQTVKKEGGQDGETEEVEELVEMHPDQAETHEEDLELELMESQITREEVSPVLVKQAYPDSRVFAGNQ